MRLLHYLRKDALAVTLALCVLHFARCTLALAQPLDDAYHTNAEILAELQLYARQYPSWMQLDSIGFSSTDSLPIWCAKISDNPDRIEPEAALLFIGQVHAEEVIGVELVLEIMKQMLENQNDNPMRQRLEGLEIYIIPTANPEGHAVVTSGVDVTYRKNKRDNVGDGVLRIQEGEGWDTSGVDINRNFGMHWDRGDTLFRPEQNQRYNAYRGAAPFSEPESRAIRDLALSRPFLYSIVYHSSRTGANRELLIGPWYWEQNGTIKRPPDASAINALGEALADHMPVQNFDSTFWYGQSTQRKGQLQDWFYVETGCIQYMAEIGAEIQPDSATMRQVVDDQLAAVWYLMDLALGLEGLEGYGTLTVIASDRETGEPISAKVEINGETHPILTSRWTQRETGRFDWLLPAGEYPLRILKHGYEMQAWGNYQITDGERVVLEVALDTMEKVDYEVNLKYGNEEFLDFRLRIEDIDNNFVIDRFYSDLHHNFELPLGRYYWTFIINQYLPIIMQANVERPVMHGSVPIDLILAHDNSAFSEPFSAPVNYPHEGNGWGITSFDGRSCLTESVVGDYPSDADLWLELPEIVRLDTARATMRIVHLPYAEPEDDYQQIEWWTNPEDVHSKRYSQLRRFRRPPAGDGPEEPDWDTLYISLDSLERGSLSVRFRTVSDESIAEDGWLIDEVAVFVEGYVNAVHEESLPVPVELSLSAFPNPFNSSVTISFSVGQVSKPVRLAIYDLSGRIVADLTSNIVIARNEATKQSLVWDASGCPAGLYFVRLEAGVLRQTKKVLLVK